ncbi:MAG TPA: WXG100 family type VII secretion target [Chloroflexota bacterium]|nr:WXG100 family type VII secretion target [Chloroflexota bacterium]
MADEIRAHYDELDQVSTQFSNLSQVVQDMEQKVKASYGKLRDKGWIGMGADAFFNEMESLIFPATDRLHQAMDEASQTTKKISQSVKQAETEASNLFKQ